MKFLSNLHPKVAFGAAAAVLANLATIAATLASATSWWEAALLALAADGPIVVAWIKRADPTVGAVVEALEPVLEEKIRDQMPSPGQTPLVVPEPGVSPATTPPAEVETDPFGKPIVK